MSEVLFGSVTMIAELPEWPFDYQPIPKAHWEAGDYVVAEVLPQGEGTHEGFELTSGRHVHAMTGDLLVGAFARRFATLEAGGSFEAIGDDGIMNCMSQGGCFGLITSKSRFTPRLMRIRYVGHVMVAGDKTNMRDHVPEPPDTKFELPVLLIVGTSMSAGKTFSARVAVRLLKELGHKVVAAKLTGAGRRRDVLSMGDAGADHIFDFIDAGLPTSICPPEEYKAAVGGLLSRMADTDATVTVIEAGASPLEPYNGATVVELLGDHIAYTVLCASDPYGVVGIQGAWDRKFDLVAGPSANTEAGIQLVRRLCDLPALDLMSDESYPDFRRRLEEVFGNRGTD